MPCHWYFLRTRSASFGAVPSLASTQNKVLSACALKRFIFRLVRSRLIKFFFFRWFTDRSCWCDVFCASNTCNTIIALTHKADDSREYCFSFFFVFCTHTHNHRHSRNTVIHRQSGNTYGHVLLLLLLLVTVNDLSQAHWYDKGDTGLIGGKSSKKRKLAAVRLQTDDHIPLLENKYWSLASSMDKRRRLVVTVPLMMIFFFIQARREDRTSCTSWICKSN